MRAGKLHIVRRAWEPSRREPIADCPQPETPFKPVQYVPQPEIDRRVARAVLQNARETTPGGICHEQFRSVRHPLKTALAAFPFVALVLLVIIAAAARYHP
jgi:hypothetical protein